PIPTVIHIAPKPNPTAPPTYRIVLSTVYLLVCEALPDDDSRQRGRHLQEPKWRGARGSEPLSLALAPLADGQGHLAVVPEVGARPGLLQDDVTALRLAGGGAPDLPGLAEVRLERLLRGGERLAGDVRDDAVLLRELRGRGEGLVHRDLAGLLALARSGPAGENRALRGFRLQGDRGPEREL